MLHKVFPAGTWELAENAKPYNTAEDNFLYTWASAVGTSSEIHARVLTVDWAS